VNNVYICMGGDLCCTGVDVDIVSNTMRVCQYINFKKILDTDSTINNKLL
jgi:hypothetical protein